MTQMLQSKTIRLTKEKRKQYIKDNIAQHTQEEIAGLCGVSRATISRDIRDMRTSGEWLEWVETELLRIHRSPDLDNNTKYREMCKLYAKSIITKAEVYTKGTQTINVVFDKAMKDESKEKAKKEPEEDESKDSVQAT